MVGQMQMGVWLPQVIGQWGGSHDTQPFCDYLLNRLTASATPQQMQSVQGFHFGAFKRRQGHRAPVFWFIRNAEIGPGGRYRQFPQWQFRSDEQLLGRDYASIAPQDVRSQLVTFEEVERIPVWYRNGDLGAFTFTADMLELSGSRRIRVRAPSNAGAMRHANAPTGRLLICRRHRTALWSHWEPPITGCHE
jgi:hypothetical protein